MSHIPRSSSGLFIGVGAPQGAVPASRRRGRGAGLNPSGRFEAFQRESVDDGWESVAELPAFKTDVTVETPRRIITRNDSPDISFDRSINPYRGCEHGCVYCFARPTHAHMGLSPGLDFETRLFAKPDAPDLLEKELAAKGYQPRVIAIGTNTDPYQPIERQHRIMRRVLEVLDRHSHPVGIVTKSALVLRDLDILTRMAERDLVKVAVSVTTLDPKLARRMEPRAAAPHRRLQTIETLAAAGVPTAAMVAPIVPAISDHEIETILERVAAAGAREAGYVLLRLPHEVKDLFSAWLEEHYPDRAAKVMSIMQSMRGGKAYDAAWGQRMTGTGPYAWAIGRRFQMAITRQKLNRIQTNLRLDLFSPPASDSRQLALFA